MPASRSARATSLMPRSCPSNPTLPTSTLIGFVATVIPFYPPLGLHHRQALPGGWADPYCAFASSFPHSLLQGWPDSPLLRASSDHSFIVGALRAQRAVWPPRASSSFYLFQVIPSFDVFL